MLSDDPWIGIFSFFRLVLTQVGVNLSIAIKSLIDCNFNASDLLQCCYSVYSIKQKLGFIWLYETSHWTFIRYTFTKYGEANLKHVQFYLRDLCLMSCLFKINITWNQKLIFQISHPVVDWHRQARASHLVSSDIHVFMGLMSYAGPVSRLSRFGPGP